MAAVPRGSSILLLVIVSTLHLTCGRMQDLTYKYTSTGMSLWPGHKPFKLKEIFKDFVKPGIWLAYNDFETGEHIGTHLDAPHHFSQHGKTVDQVALAKLHGPAVVIDITKKAEQDGNAVITIEDILNWENKYGMIPKGAWIVMNSGWGKYWGDQMKFVGTDSAHSVAQRKWPGIGPDATRWLFKNRRHMSGVAVDVVSCDPGNGNFTFHALMLPNDILCLENLANAETLPECGAEIRILPMNIEKGTGAPARVYAVWDEDNINNEKCNVWNAAIVLGAPRFNLLLLIAVITVFLTPAQF